METHPKVAEEAYLTWSNGFTAHGKVPIKDLQEIYDTAYVSKLITTPVPLRKVMDYTLPDKVLREKR